jgi:hypothetical protein
VEYTSPSFNSTVIYCISLLTTAGSNPVPSARTSCVFKIINPGGIDCWTRCASRRTTAAPPPTLVSESSCSGRRNRRERQESGVRRLEHLHSNERKLRNVCDNGRCSRRSDTRERQRTQARVREALAQQQHQNQTTT